MTEWEATAFVVFVAGWEEVLGGGDLRDVLVDLRNQVLVRTRGSGTNRVTSHAGLIVNLTTH